MSFGNSVRVLAAACISFAASANTSEAGPLPPYQITGVNGALTGPGHYGFVTPRSALSIDVGLALPTITLEIDSNGDTISGQLNLSYYFRIVGPAGFVPIAYNANQSIHLTSIAATAQVSGISFIGIYNSSNVSVLSDETRFFYNTSPAGPGGIYSYTSKSGFGLTVLNTPDVELHDKRVLGATFLTDGVYRVDLSVSAFILQSTLEHSLTKGSFYTDPVIMVDPAFTNSNLYTVEFSDGIGNGVAATPIPTTLPLFATGLGIIGFAAGHRKRRLRFQQ